MKIIKKLTAVSLSLIFALSMVIPAFAAESNSFTPVIRFVAASDTHVRDDSDENAERITKMLKMAYSIADSDRSYKKLDAVLIAGDLTNDGTKTEFDKFRSAVFGSLRDETRFLGVVAQNHDGYEMSRKEERGYYESVTGNTADFNVVINGFHFIGLSASANDAVRYDTKQISWLDKQLSQAKAEDPEKPVIFIHHEPNLETVYGSSVYDGWGIPQFGAVLNKYPQVVDFAGHSHYPVNDPRSIWQGRYTAVGTGAVYYSEFTIDWMRVYHPADSNQTANFWIVEIDKDNNMRLCGYDILAGKKLCETILDNPADTANREYTPVKREAASKAPEFADGVKPQIETAYGGFKVTVPVAESTDGMPVVLYRIAVKNKLGVTVYKDFTLPCYYRALEQDSVEFNAQALAKGDYTVSVIAENAYGKQSSPVTTTVTIDGENPVSNIFTLLSVFFGKVKDFFENIR